MASNTSRITLTERGMQIAERRIPEIAAKAGHEAYLAALKHTGAVLNRVFVSSPDRTDQARAPSSST
jgi:protein PhnA